MKLAKTKIKANLGISCAHSPHPRPRLASFHQYLFISRLISLFLRVPIHIDLRLNILIARRVLILRQALSVVLVLSI